MPLQPIKEFLDKAVKKSGIAGQVEAAMILEETSKILSELFGSRADNGRVKPMYVKNRTLTVACMSSVLAQEIKLNERKILDRVNDRFGSVVDRLRYLV